MIVTKGNPSVFETRLLTSIKDVTAKNIKFEKVCFMVESIEDADGRLFVRKSDDKSRWFDLFGTPELAAKTAWLLLMCRMTIDCDDGEAALLEWLRGDA